jgi:hypothetical protein
MSPEYFENIPSQMKALDRWVCHAKGSKAPRDAKMRKASGSSTNVATWASFPVAMERVKSGDYAGLGFILNGDGLVVVDIDHCVTQGVPDPKAIRLLEEMGATYIEVSISGTGLHAFGYAEQLEKGCKGNVDGLSVEVYSSVRFMIVTGNIISKTNSLSRLKGFKELSQRLKPEYAIVQGDDPTPLYHQTKHNELIRRIISGDVFHDSLRDLSASYISSGMASGSAVIALRALMQQSSGKNTDRWNKRYKQIPELVESAKIKFSDVNFEASLDAALFEEAPKFKLLTSADLAALPAQKWLIASVLPAEGLAAIYGPSGSGKSFLALSMCAAIAAGDGWFGHRTEQAPVIYLALEGEGGIKVRVKAWEKHHSQKLTDEMRLVLQSFKISDRSDLAQLIAAIRQFHTQGAVVVIDTLNRAAPTADENSSKDMGEIIEGAKLIQSNLGGLCILVHHTGKDQSKGMRGHSSLFAALDASIEVTRTKSARSWNVAKSKDGEDDLTHPFDLEIINLGVNEYGDPITSCVVVETSSVVVERSNQLSDSGKLALSTFYEAAEKNLEEADSVAVSVNLKDWRKIYYKRSTADNYDGKRKAFDRGRKQLTNAGVLSVENDIYTSNEITPSHDREPCWLV